MQFRQRRQPLHRERRLGGTRREPEQALHLPGPPLLLLQALLQRAATSAAAGDEGLSFRRIDVV